MDTFADRYFDSDPFSLTADSRPPFDPLRFFLLLILAAVGFGMIYSLAGCEHVWASQARLPGEDASDRLEAAGTLLRIIDTGLFKWGARLFAGICIMSSAWALKEQRFGFAVICVVGALLFGTAPKWVKNIFDIGDNQGLFSRAASFDGQRSLARAAVENFSPTPKPVPTEGVQPIALALQGRFPSWSGSKVQRLAQHIASQCLSHKVDPALVLAVIHVESRFKPDAVSVKGALGLMQLMPGTARFVAGMLSRKAPSSVQLQNPFTNTRLGIAYLAWLSERYAGDLPQVLGAYNSGPGRVDGYMKRHARYASAVTREYIESVLKKQAHFRSLGIELAGPASPPSDSGVTRTENGSA